MHIPSPLGSYPLTLRDFNVTNPRDGELLLDYENSDLYYINRSTHEKVRMADEIYRRILEAKLQNAKFIIYNKDKEKKEPVKDGVISLDSCTISGTCIKFDNEKDETYVTDTTLVLDDSDFIWPRIRDREYNAFYFIVNGRVKATSRIYSNVLDLDGTSAYVANDQYEPDPDGHILVLPMDMAYAAGNRIVITADLDGDEDDDELEV